MNSLGDVALLAIVSMLAGIFLMLVQIEKNTRKGG